MTSSEFVDNHAGPHWDMSDAPDFKDSAETTPTDTVFQLTANERCDTFNPDPERREKERTINIIPIPPELAARYDFLAELPTGVGVMGGTARSIAREIITGEREPIRDIDLVNILDEEGLSQVDQPTLDALGQEFMPDDYSFGHGISSETLGQYFSSRDFTINQALILDGKLLVSDAGYDDLQENIIRPSCYELPNASEWLSDRLFLKALMMQTVLEQVSTSVPTLENIRRTSASDFNIALFLNKAMSRGVETAEKFTKSLAEWRLIDSEFAGYPEDLAIDLLAYRLYDFEFRPTRDGRIDQILGTTDLAGFFPPTMQNYRINDPAIREVMSEYDERFARGGKRAPLIETDRPVKHYAQADYDYINSFCQRWVYEDD